MTRKDFRIDQLNAVCVKKGWTPKTTGFADRLFGIMAAYFQLERRTARHYIKTLIDAWNHDKWATFVRGNELLTDEEKEAWIKQYS